MAFCHVAFLDRASKRTKSDEVFATGSYGVRYAMEEVGAGRMRPLN